MAVQDKEHCMEFLEKATKLNMDAISIFKEGIQLLSGKLNKVRKERDLLKLEVIQFEQERKKWSDKLKFQSLEIINLRALMKANTQSDNLEDAKEGTQDDEVEIIVSIDSEDQEIRPSLSRLPQENSPTTVFIIDEEAKADYSTTAIVEKIRALNDSEFSDSDEFDLSCGGVQRSGDIFEDVHITAKDEIDDSLNDITDERKEQDSNDGAEFEGSRLDAGEPEQHLEARSEEQILAEGKKRDRACVKEGNTIVAKESQEEEFMKSSKYKKCKHSRHPERWRIGSHVKVEPPLDPDFNQSFKGIEDELLSQKIDKTYGSSSGLSVKQRIPGGSQLSNSYFSPGDRKLTVDSMRSKREYACDICGKLLSSRSNLNAHRHLHTGQKPFRCNECGVCFARLYALQMHLRTHTGEKPYICECGKRFARISNYKRHKMTHLTSKISPEQSCALTVA